MGNMGHESDLSVTGNADKRYALEVELDGVGMGCRCCFGRALDERRALLVCVHACSTVPTLENARARQRKPQHLPHRSEQEMRQPRQGEGGKAGCVIGYSLTADLSVGNPVAFDPTNHQR